MTMVNLFADGAKRAVTISTTIPGDTRVWFTGPLGAGDSHVVVDDDGVQATIAIDADGVVSYDLPEGSRGPLLNVAICFDVPPLDAAQIVSVLCDSGVVNVSPLADGATVGAQLSPDAPNQPLLPNPYVFVTWPQVSVGVQLDEQA